MIRWIVFCPVINKIGWLAIKSHLPACLSIKQWLNRWIVTFFSELEWSQSRNQLRQLWGCRKVCLLLPLKYFWPLLMADVFSCLPRISSSWRVWWSKVGPTMDSVRLPSWVRVAGLCFDSRDASPLGKLVRLPYQARVIGSSFDTRDVTCGDFWFSLRECPLWIHWVIVYALKAQVWIVRTEKWWLCHLWICCCDFPFLSFVLLRCFTPLCVVEWSWKTGDCCCNRYSTVTFFFFK